MPRTRGLGKLHVGNKTIAQFSMFHGPRYAPNNQMLRKKFCAAHDSINIYSAHCFT
jgi:hypothetical protein